jgi:hypothetical protein
MKRSRSFQRHDKSKTWPLFCSKQDGSSGMKLSAAMLARTHGRTIWRRHVARSRLYPLSLSSINRFSRNHFLFTSLCFPSPSGP